MHRIGPTERKEGKKRLEQKDKENKKGYTAGKREKKQTGQETG
jgi:hypothetical protein